jgi:glycosyltransferase involved in cell wall biosynthesis
MKILFDHQIYSNQNYGGISRYFYELTKRLVIYKQEYKHSIYFSDNEFTRDRSIFNARPFIPVNFKGRETIKKYINQKYSDLIISKGDFDIFHPTYYDTYYLKRGSLSKPFVFTFHDLIHEKFAHKYPDTLTDLNEVIACRNTLLRHSAAVIAVSQSTKNDILQYYDVDESKIHVIHLANSLNLNAAERDSSMGEYILFVGHRDIYKNFRTYVSAIQPLLDREKSLKLICAGGGSFTPDEQNFLRKLGITSQVVQTPINDTILTRLYRNSLFFVFPSLYEGFGIPTLEAFNCECPAILSNVSSLPEVGGDAALYIDPNDSFDMLSKTEAFYYNPELRDEYRMKGRKQAEKYSWDKMALHTMAIYQSLS